MTRATLRNDMQKWIKFFLISVFLFHCIDSYALLFSITPKSGTLLPTQLIWGNTVTALYTVKNNSSRPFINAYVKYLPPNTSQITSDTQYPDLCSSTFNLQPGGSCTLELSISGSINSQDPDPHQHLFVCLPGGLTCAGTPNPLNVVVLGVTATPETFSSTTSRYYTSRIAGPGFLAILVENHDPLNKAIISIITPPALQSNISITNITSGIFPDPIYGNFLRCQNGLQLGSAGSSNSQCLIVLQATPFDPSLPPLTGTLTISVTINTINYNLTLNNLTNTTVLYIGGDFNQIGNSAVSPSQYLLAQCQTSSSNVTSCSNYLAGTHPYANKPIHRIALADNGNLYVGGEFDQLANVDLSNTSHFLLANCTSGVCQNAVSDTNNYANQAIDDISVTHDLTLYVGGEFNQLGSADVGSNHFLLAQCSNLGHCVNYFTSGKNVVGDFANGAIHTVRFDSENQTLYAAGAFTEINHFDSGLSSPNSFLAQCIGLTCSNFITTSPNYANDSIFAVDDADRKFYVAGNFYQIANISVDPSKFLLAELNTNVTPNTWRNYLTGATDPTTDGAIHATVFDGNNNLYVGGEFHRIADSATLASNKFLLAKCRTGGICTNFLNGLTLDAANGAIYTLSIGSVLQQNLINPSR